MSIAEAARVANERQKGRLVAKVRAHFAGDVVGRSFAVWGLAFKPHTDDVRESPALTIIDELLAAGARVRAYDPRACDTARVALGSRDGLDFYSDPYEAVVDVDGLLLCTEWSQFRAPDFDRLRRTMRSRALFDGRNQWDPQYMARLGFYWHGVGRPGCNAPTCFRTRSE